MKNNQPKIKKYGYRSLKDNNLKNLFLSAGLIGLVSFAPDVMAATDELKTVAEGVHKMATGSGMKIGLIAASVSCIVAGLINNAILKPMMALGGVAGCSPLILDWINTKYSFLI